MCIVHRNRLGSKVDGHAHVVERTDMDLVSAIAGWTHAAGTRQEIGEHLVAPTSPVVIWIAREHNCHVRPRIGHENRGTDKYKITRSAAFAFDRFTENIDVSNFSLVQRPPGNWNRAHNASDSIGRCIKTTERQDGRCAVDIHLNILPRIQGARGNHGDPAARGGRRRDLQGTVSRSRSGENCNVWLVG